MDTATVAISDNASQEKPIIHVYRRRLYMLGLFSVLSMMSAITFPEWVVMADVNSCFYGVSEEAINWTSLMFEVVYIVLTFPTSFLISNYLGLKWTLMCTCFTNVLGTGLQFATTTPDSFVYVLISSFISALSNLLILGIPPFLAAKWFPSHELSRACAVGVFGNQLGVALGFVVSPLIVASDCDQKDLIGIGKRNVAYILCVINVVIFILVTFTFQNAPKLPPSLGEAQKKKDLDIPYTKVVISMLKNKDFILVFIVYGFMVGSYFAIGTTLNELIIIFFPDSEEDIGWMGLLFILSGLLGSLIAGWVLDTTQKFKETTFSICVASVITFIIFSGCLYINHIYVQFITIGIFGFFLTSFLPIGFEYGIEVTYPLSEPVCACLLNTSTMTFGAILTEIVSHILQSKGALSSNAALLVILILCCVISSFITKNYKRSKKSVEEKNNIPK